MPVPQTLQQTSQLPLDAEHHIGFTQVDVVLSASDSTRAQSARGLVASKRMPQHGRSKQFTRMALSAQLKRVIGVLQ